MVDAAIEKIEKSSKELEIDLQERQQKMDVEMKTVLKNNSREKADMMVKMDALQNRI
jgi:hypothetical protein